MWWRADEELEIVGHEDQTVTLAAEAKWTNDLVGMDVLRTLQRRAALLPKLADDARLALFSKTGFTPAVEAARDPYLLLFTLDDLLADNNSMSESDLTARDLPWVSFQRHRAARRRRGSGRR